jgi:hypothetical protein
MVAGHGTEVFGGTPNTGVRSLFFFNMTFI